MEGVVRARPLRRRAHKWFLAVLATTIVAAGLVAAPQAVAATSASFSGTGPGSSAVIALSAGIYGVELSYANNSDEWGATNFITHLETVSGDDESYLSNDIADSGSIRQVIRLNAAESVWLDVANAAQAATWSASLTRLGAGNATTVPYSASFTGRDTTGLLQLPAGVYSATVTYSANNDSYGATNFIMDFENESRWQDTVFNDIATSGSITKNLRVSTAGFYWFNVTDAAQSVQWSISMKSLTGVQNAKFSATPTPKVSGKAKVGKKLKAKTGTWKPSGATFTYQWYRNSSKIAGATQGSDKLTKQDRGKKIKVAVTVSKLGYVTVTKTSKATSKVKK
jgi:hypothetical protein